MSVIAQTRSHALAVAMTALAVVSCSQLSPQPPSPPSVSVEMDRFEYEAGSKLKSAAWKVRAAFDNQSPSAWKLDQSLLVIETSSEGDLTASHYVFRERAGSKLTDEDFRDRYATSFGYEVETDGTAIVPFLALQELVGESSGGFGSFLGLFLATFSSPQVDPLPGGGYGQVAPRSILRFEENVIAPLGPRQRGPIIVVVPSMRRVGGEEPPHHVWFEFTAPEVRYGDRLSAGVQKVAPRTAAELIMEVRDETAPLWRRRLELNWLAEDFPAEAAPLLKEYAFAEGNPLRNTALMDLGVARVTDAAPMVIPLIDDANDKGRQVAAIRTLGRIQAVGAAPRVRALLASSDQSVRSAAMSSLGEMPDPESVPELLRAAQSRPPEARDAARAILAMNSDAATTQFVEALANPSIPVVTRRSLINAVDDGAPPAIVQRLLTLANDSSGDAQVRTAAVSAVGRAGGAAALEGLRALLVQGGELGASAVDALASRPDESWRAPVIDVARDPNHQLRSAAIEALGTNHVTSASEVLRAIVEEPGGHNKTDACNALDRMNQKPAACGG